MEPFFVVVIHSCLERKGQTGYGMSVEQRIHATHVCGERGLVTDSSTSGYPFCVAISRNIIELQLWLIALF